MNKLINTILKEAKEDDPFFQPKTEKRDEEIKKQRKEFIHKIELGLQNIKIDYKNKDWSSEEERLFLKIFSKFHLDEIKNYDGVFNYVLRNKNNEWVGTFDLSWNEFWIRHNYVCAILGEEFHLNYPRTQSFIQNMLNKYFKLNEITYEWSITISYR